MPGKKSAEKPAKRAKPARVALVFGVGPERGLGAALARRFAREGLRVVLAGRTPARLELVADSIRQAGGKAHVRVADATWPEEVAEAFDFAATKGALELVVCNVGANHAGSLLDASPELFESLWRQNAFGGFLVGAEAASRLVASGAGTILFTGATASLRARPPFAAFAAAKAALRAVAQGLARECGPRGVHVAHVVIDGVIDGEYAAEAFPEYFAARGAEGRLDPDAIADAYWAIHRQSPSAWTHEIDLRPFGEPF